MCTLVDKEWTTTTELYKDLLGQGKLVGPLGRIILFIFSPASLGWIHSNAAIFFKNARNGVTGKNSNE